MKKGDDKCNVLMHFFASAAQMPTGTSSPICDRFLNDDSCWCSTRHDETTTGQVFKRRCGTGQTGTKPTRLEQDLSTCEEASLRRHHGQGRPHRPCIEGVVYFNSQLNRRAGLRFCDIEAVAYTIIRARDLPRSLGGGS